MTKKKTNYKISESYKKQQKRNRIFGSALVIVWLIPFLLNIFLYSEISIILMVVSGMFMTIGFWYVLFNMSYINTLDRNLSVTIFILILFVIGTTVIEKNSEKNFCENNSFDCECLRIGDSSNLPITFCESEYDRLFFETKLVKKNDCQLYLQENNGKLGEDCICEEYVYSLPAIPSNCFKAECKTNNTESDTTVPYDYSNGYLILSNQENFGCEYIKKDSPECNPPSKKDCSKAREKVFPDDFTCDEINEIYEDTPLGKPILKKYARVDILKIYGDKGCFE